MTYFIIILLSIWLILFLIVRYLLLGILKNRTTTNKLKELEYLKRNNKISDSLYVKKHTELDKQMESRKLIVLGITVVIIYASPLVVVTYVFIKDFILK